MGVWRIRHPTYGVLYDEGEKDQTGSVSSHGATSRSLIYKLMFKSPPAGRYVLIPIPGKILAASYDIRWPSIWRGLQRPFHMQDTTPHIEKGQNMTERRETRQEQEVRWDAQRTARDKEFQAGQHARRKKNWWLWLTVAVLVLIITVTAVALL